MEPELFAIERDGSNPRWIPQPWQTGPRTYHSTAVLLPDARVLIGGGDTRGAFTVPRRRDYQIFEPHYLQTGLPRPVITATPPAIRYGAAFTLGVGSAPPNQTLASVVLMRPGSVTHHTDYDQRFKSLEILRRSPGQLVVKSPANGRIAPPGYYMVFVVSSEGTPSVAGWTHLR